MAYLTVVYQVNDEAAFKPELDRLVGLFKSDASMPYRVTAWSKDHEMRRLSLIDEALEEEDDIYDLKDAVTEIMQSGDVIEFERQKKSPTQEGSSHG